MVMSIQDYIMKQLDEGVTHTDIAAKLGVSLSMISLYKKHYNPSLEVAIKAYQHDKVVLLPFSKEGIKREIQRRTRL